MKWNSSIALLPALFAVLAGLVVSSCGDGESVVPPMPDTPAPIKFEDGPELSGANAWLHAKLFCELGPRPNQSEALKLSRRHITETLQKLGWSVEDQRFTSPTPLGDREFVNLIARFQSDKGSTPKGVLSGHIDTKDFSNIEFIGANDGASHTGLLLELARVLSQRPKQAQQIELVFFDGEEAFGAMIQPGKDGLYGSTHYAKYYRGKASGEKPKWAINLDMVGHRQLQIEVPSDTPPQLYAAYRKAAAALPQGSKRFKVSYGPIIDDHLPLNQAGIPAIDIIQGGFTGSNWWHQKDDTLEILSPSSLELTGKLTLKMVEQLLE